MPQAPLRQCPHPGCKVLVRGAARCKAHERQYDRNRPSSAARGYNSTRWRALRRRILAYEPWCRECRKQDVFERATDVDHIIRHKGPGDPLFYEIANLQPLCHSCHSRKTTTEKGGFGR